MRDVPPQTAGWQLRRLTPDAERAYVQRLAHDYASANVTLTDLAAREQLTRQTLAKLFKRHGVPLRRGGAGHKARLARLLQAHPDSRGRERQRLLGMTVPAVTPVQVAALASQYWDTHLSLPAIARQAGVSGVWLGRLFTYWQVPTRWTARTVTDAGLQAALTAQQVKLPQTAAERAFVEAVADRYRRDRRPFPEFARQVGVPRDRLRALFRQYDIPRRRSRPAKTPSVSVTRLGSKDREAGTSA